MKFLSNILVKAGLIVEGTTNLQGTATALTPATSDNTTKIATTAFVKAQGYLTGSSQLDWNNVINRPTTLSGYGITDPVVLTSGSYTNPSWIVSLAWNKITGTPTSLSGYGITDPVVLTSGSYTNPSWIVSLAWSKITGTPTSLAGYGITDPVVLTSGSYSNPSWIIDLAWSKITGTPTTLSGYGITDGVPSSRTITINGTSQDLSANRTFSVGTVTSVAALTLGTTGTDLSSSVANGTTTPVITLNVPTASATNRGALSSADWTTFNNKQNAITLTTTGSSGSSTLVGATLNIPTYTLAGLGGISLTSLSAFVPLIYNNTTGQFSIIQSNSTNDGYLSAADWTTFNGKVGGSGTSGQIAYFNGTNSITSSPTFAFTPTSQLLVNNSVTAASAIARGINATPTLTAAANNDVLVGLDINPTFTNGAFTGVSNFGLRVGGNSGLAFDQTNLRLGIGTPTLGSNLPNSWSGTGTTVEITSITTQSSGLLIRRGGNNSIGLDVWSKNDAGSSYIDNRYDQAGAFGLNIRVRTSGTPRTVAIFDDEVGAKLGDWTNNRSNAARIEGDLSFRSGGGSRTITGPLNAALIINARPSLSTEGVILQYNGSTGFLLNNAGNVLVNTTTDAGFRLDVNGTARMQGSTTITGSTTASASIARGINATPTLVAAANNDVLVGLDINPTFTNGAFTGVMNYGIRSFLNLSGIYDGLQIRNTAGGANAQSRIKFDNDITPTQTSTGAVIFYTSSVFSGFPSNTLGFYNYNSTGALAFGTNAGERMRMFSTGNVLIQNGGTFTDAGFRLDVNGTARVQGVITGSVSGGTLTMGASATNQTGLNLSGFFPNTGAIATAGLNQRSFNTVIGGQQIGFSATFTGNNQGVTTTSNYFNATGAINNTNGTNQINGFLFNPTFTSETSTTIYAFTSNMPAASNRWNLYFDGTAQNYLAGDVMIGTTTAGGRFTIQPTNNQVGMAISGSSLTGSNAQSLVSLSQTWNTTGNPTAFLLNITNTASGATADLMDLQVGGASRFEITAAGRARLGAYGSGTITGTATYNLAVDASGNVIEVTGGGGGGIGGSGTTNYLPKFTASTTLGDSRFFDNGTVTFLGNGDVNGTPSTGIFSGTGGTGTNIAGAELRIRGGASTGNAAGGIISFYTSAAGSSGTGVNAATERMRIDALGNLGLGISPSPWAFSGNFDLNNDQNIFAGTTGIGLGINAYFNAGWKYKGTGQASYYKQISGGHEWYSAPSGTVGNAISFTQTMTLNASGNLGLGTTTVGSRLQVNGNAAIGYSASTAAPTNGLVVAGSTGIGTASPNSYAGYGALTLNGATNGGIIDFTTGGTLIGEILNVSTDFIVSAFANVPLSFRTNNVERGRFLAGGGLIIGNGETASSPSTGIISGTGGSGTNIAGAEFRIRGGASTGNAAGGPITFYTSAAGAAGTGANAATERMRITTSGSVGIGTNNPTGDFEVRGAGNTSIRVSSTGNFPVFQLRDDRATVAEWNIENGRVSSGTLGFFYATGNATRMIITSAGNVGIQTTTVGSALQVNGNAAIGYSASTAAPTNGLAVAGNVGIGISNPSATLSLSGTGNIGIRIKAGSATNNVAYIDLSNTDSGNPLGAIAHNNTTGDLYFSTGGNVRRMGISNTGLVGINTTTPTGRLHVDPDDNEIGLNVSTSSLTGSNAQSLVDLAQTWNTTGNPAAIKLNITNTASGASSYLMDLQVGSATQFRVTKAGAIRTAAPTSGTANDWKLGSVVGGTTVLDTTQWLEVEVGGTLYRVALVTLPEPEPGATPASTPEDRKISEPVKTSSQRIQELENEIQELRKMVNFLMPTSKNKK